MSDIAKRLVHNTLYNFAGRFVSRLANFFLVPYVLATIGMGEYGLFSLLNVFFYFASLADLGTGAGLMRFMAADVARGDMAVLGRRVFGQLLFCFALTLGLVLLWQLSGVFLLSFFHLPENDVLRMRFLVMAFLIAMGLGCMSNVFQSVLLGYQRMDWTNAIGMALVVPNVAGTLYLLQRGFGLVGLVWVFFVVQGIGLLFSFLAVGRLCPTLQWARHWPDRESFLPTVRLGMQVQWMRVVATLSKTLDQLLLAPMVGLSAVTTYALAGKPVLLVQEVGTLILSATVPVVAHLDSRDDAGRVAKLLRLSQGTINFFVGAAVCGFLLMSGFLVRLWLGPGYEHVAQVMRILALGHLLSLLITPGVNQLMGKGNMAMLTPILTLQTVLQVLLSWWAIKTIGLLGPAVGLCMAVVYGTAHFLISFYRIKAVAVKA